MTEETLFADALDAPDRAAFLAANCTDPAVRRKVEELLAAHDRAGGFLRTDPNATHTHQPAADADVLPLLGPPSRPNSLGRLGHYEVLEVVGKGGFGTVLKAFDDRLHRVVAVKVLAPTLAASGSARARFLREGRTAAAVRDAHVVAVHAVSGDDDTVPYLVMEFIAGQTLQQKLDKVGPLPPAEVLRIGGQIARGLAAADATGLIHRDVKPANILLENGVERVKLSDFGLARAADDASLSQSGVVAGTPMYMSPEQARGEAVDARSDLFSLGSVLYAMCAGRPPFRAESALAVLKRVCEDDPRPLRQVNPQVPRWLTEVVERLHAKEPADRFQSAAEVAELLAGYQAELAQRGTVTPNRAVGRREARRRGSPVLRLLLGLMLTAGVLGVVACAGYLLVPVRPPAVDPERPAPPPLDPDRWGTLVDPLGGSIVKPLDAATIAIGLTGRAQQILHPALNLDAPRLLWDVDGDFRFETGVFAFDPPAEGTGHRPKVSWRAAGVVVWQDDARFLRFEQAAWAERPDLKEYLHLEAFGPAPADEQYPRPARDSIVHLQVERRGDRWTFRVSDDGRTWADVRTLDGLGYARRLKVGVVACNGTRDGMTVGFRLPTLVQFTGVEPGVAAALADEVAAKTRLRDRAKQRLDAGAAPPLELLAAEVELTEARVKLAEATGDRTAVAARLGELVTHRAEERRLTAERVNAGVEVKDALDRADARLAEAKGRLAAAGGAVPTGDRFTPLFNGKDLTGWKTHPDQPGDWRVDAQGVLVGRGNLSHLFSERADYADFHLRAEARVNDGGNGGVYVRVPVAELPRDGTFPTGVKLPIDSTGRGEHTGSLTLALTPDKDVEVVPGQVTAPPGEWFTLEIIARGATVTLRVNGATTAEYPKLPAAFARGHIVLQLRDPGTVIEFRKIEVKELPTPAPAEGFVPLFNGKDLSGWVRSPRPDLGEWTVKDGILEGRTRQRDYLFTERGDYRDFHLRVEAQVTPNGDGGLMFRCEKGLSSKFGTARGYETEISALKDVPHGTLRLGPEGPDNTVLAKPIADRAGKWFTQEVIVRGNRIVVKVDGETVLDHTSAKEHYARGHLGLQVWGEKTVVRFRKVEVKELPAEAAALPAKAADIIAFVNGPWRCESEVVVPKPPPGQARASGVAVFEPVAGGRFSRGRGFYAPGREMLILYGTDASGNPVRYRATSDGVASGPAAGLLDPSGKAISWIERLPDGRTSFHQFELVAGDTVSTRMYTQDAANAITSEIRTTFARSAGPLPLPDSPVDPKRPAEATVLDRLVGEWRTDVTVQPAFVSGPPTVEVWRTTARTILGGRFVEMVGANDATGASDYAVVWYDPAARAYRQWYFNSDGQTLTLTGTWDAAANALSWETADKVKSGRWVLTADRREYRHVILGRAGHVVSEATGVSRRVAVGFVPLFNGRDLSGWKQHATEADRVWDVKDGVLSLAYPRPGRAGAATASLFSRRDDYTDFHLRVEARCRDGGVATVGLRAPFDMDEWGLVRCMGTGLGRRAGNVFLWDRTVTPKDRPLPDDTWFTQEWIFRGRTLVVKLDGVEVATHADLPDEFRAGHVLLTAQPAKVQFRKIEIKEMPPEPAAAVPTWLDLIRRRAWPNGSTVTVGFVDARPHVEAAVRAAAAEWGKYANLRIEFPADPATAQIRVTSDPRRVREKYRAFLQPGKVPGSSALGTQARDRTEFPDATLWLDPSDDLKPTIAGTARHEFGHALGLGHEQDRVNPAQGYMVNFGPTNTPLDRFDPLSVMIHPDDPKDVPPGKATVQNLELSEQDKKLIAAVYPGRKP